MHDSSFWLDRARNDRFFRSDYQGQDCAFVTCTANKGLETFLVDSLAYRSVLRARAPEQTISDKDLDSVIATIRARVLLSADEGRVAVRRAEVGGQIFIDPFDADGKVILIGPNLVDLVNDDHVRWVRTPGMLPMPLPNLTNPAEVGDLYMFLPCTYVPDFFRIVAWLVLVILGVPLQLVLRVTDASRWPYLLRTIKRLIDPNREPIRQAPRNRHEAAIAATSGNVLALGLITALSKSMSDTFANFSVGAPLAVRKFYHDDAEKILVSRVTVLMAIDQDVQVSKYLGNVAIEIDLQGLNQTESEETLLKAFDKEWPRLTAYLYQTASKVMADRSPVSPGPRAEARAMLPAVARELGCGLDCLLPVFDPNQTQLARLNASWFARYTMQLASTRGGHLRTSPSQLFADLEAIVPIAHRLAGDWPSVASVLSKRLLELETGFAAAGWRLTIDKSDGRRFIELTLVGATQ